MSAARSSIVITKIARTPIGKFQGSLSSLSASALASVAIRSVVQGLGDVPITEAILGTVVSAGQGQAPARQAILGAGLSDGTVCTTINKVCASGMKSVMMASQALQCGGQGNAIVAGGFESMSNIPHYLTSLRKGKGMGNAEVVDGMIHDGLWDPYDNQHMGMCAEKCATDFNISREDQDSYTVESYTRAQASLNLFEEVVPVSVPQRKGKPLVVAQDEEPHNVSIDRIPNLSPAFDRKSGTVTAANSSTLNDGACAMVLMAEETAKAHNIPILARIRSMADAAQAPVLFTTTPAMAVRQAVVQAGMSLDDIEYHEINEAFSVVALANQQLLGVQHDRLNVFGGAVALGHPIGMSGARIIGTLYQVLKHHDATIGCASICNGGGGASAMVIERVK